MKHTAILTILLLAMHLMLQGQQAYWVFLTDKDGVDFDPYTYFDAKAIERYTQCGADLRDITNYPLQQQYVEAVSALATETVGCSRWMNAIGVMATTQQVAAIASLPCVSRVQPIEADGMITATDEDKELYTYATADGPLEAQLVRMNGAAFRISGFDGKGIRIAVFDGGFPQVNTHAAFKHLRDNNLIVKTWNFPNNKEDVYGWNSHGLMTLSCIGGRQGDRDLGLATGAEYLLARTEVEAEPFKEEVWWQMAVEWADLNGANIISSSLGYGKERHYTRDMDGTSYVAKAANMAARKGMLVCNSAGNEADEAQWKTIITPADADSVLCIGGIENSLTDYNHIDFSSYGPSADGRQKPNVCAFGYALTAATGQGDNKYHYVPGTSFSCPLVAGFAACAWQASPGTTAMELFHMIERSADLYPYADYSFGYGVPQADYFCNSQPAAKEPTFRFVDDGDTVHIVPTRQLKHIPLFYSFRDPYSRRLVYYGKLDIDYADQTDAFSFSKSALFDRTLTIHLAGYTDSLTLDAAQYTKYEGMSGFTFWPKASSGAVTSGLTGLMGDLHTSVWGSNARWCVDEAFLIGLPISTVAADLPHDVWSPAARIALRLTFGISKCYRLGLGFEYGNVRYNFSDDSYNTVETTLGADALAATMNDVKSRHLNMSEYVLEFFQRVRLVPIGLFGKGLRWDLGIYGNISTSHYTLRGHQPLSRSQQHLYHGLDQLDGYRWNYGLVTRLTYDYLGLYARYRLSANVPAAPLPRLEVGLTIEF